MSTNTTKTYDVEFKKQAVQLLIRSGRPLAQIARELGVETWALRDWKKRLQPELAQLFPANYLYPDAELGPWES